MNDLDFTFTGLEGEEARLYAEQYGVKVLTEAWEMDCYEAEATSYGQATRFQNCAMRELRRKFGEDIRFLKLPEIRSATHHAGRRICTWKGGFPC